jgi:6-phosphogluconolactonase/glucosamine-6-phosphate isomerase/deaminase
VAAGGSLPKIACEQLANAELGVDFSKWHVFLADERHVPRTHEESSMRLLDEFLFSKAPIPPEARSLATDALPRGYAVCLWQQVHAIRDEVPVEEAAEAYAEGIRRIHLRPVAAL